MNCPICKSIDCSSISKVNSISKINPDDFKITESDYGRTGPLFICNLCTFKFVVFPITTQNFYSKMVDYEYEEGASYRSLQQRRIVDKLLKFKKKSDCLTLLDVGAGTGLLLKEAKSLNIEAIGLEPSKWACEMGTKKGLKLINGVLPNIELKNKTFDIITLVDVIEHVENPVGLLQLCNQQLKANGILLVNTPDSKSFFALIFGYKWWHYRIAHIGYFSKKTLKLAFDKSGFKILDLKRPTWYFELGYLYARIRKYIGCLPSFENSNSKFLGYVFRIKIPLNLKDSLEVIVCKK
jgi:2-polyprenyl-3-methyl-5-hydroxy-6-metoxy-1,4-benzoquinol methylase